MKELVSVLIPCYNHEKYIDDCIKSVVNQTYPEIELIICDDNSIDNSYVKIMNWRDRLLERFKNVVVKKNTTNIGITKNINNMIRKSQGMYIKLLASDDMLLPTAIADLIRYAKKSKADLIYSNIIYVDEDIKYPVQNIGIFKKRYNKQPPTGFELTGRLCGSNFIAAPGVLIPKETLNKYGLFDESYILEDYEYWLRVSISGNIEYIDKATALYRNMNNSLSRFEETEDGRRRCRIFQQNLKDIFHKYEKYSNIAQKNQFYNSILSPAIEINDRILVSEIVAEMKEKRYQITKINKLKVILAKIGLYIWIKRIKKIFMRK